MSTTVSEITAGQQFSRSSEGGRLADTQTRVFRVLTTTPGEGVDIQEVCNIYIGNQHPVNENIYCKSFDAKYEGDSRLVLLCTFQYGSAAGSDGSGGGNDPFSIAPDVRPPNVTTSTATIEVPVYEWKEVNDAGEEIDEELVPAKNPVGDWYEGVTAMWYIMTISVEQFVQDDPTRHSTWVGYVNSDTLRLGSLEIAPRTLLFRGLSMKPSLESWGDRVYRGWMATYEFAYKPATWDLRIPQTGYNVKAFSVNMQGVENYGQPLKHKSGKVVTPLALPDGVSAGDKVRAMVKVFEYENGGVSQLPSAQPVALNDDGYPMSSSLTPKIKRYSVYDTTDLGTALSLRIT